MQNGGIMENGKVWEKLNELTEEERIEAFSLVLGLLTEDEIADVMARCDDIIEIVLQRIEKGGYQIAG